MLFKVLLAGMCSLCLVGTATLASAHEFIVKPDKTQAAKGESVGVQAQAAHVFMISEEAEPRSLNSPFPLIRSCSPAPTVTSTALGVRNSPAVL